MPLLVAGDGPILVVSYLDDAHPAALAHDGTPPLIESDVVSGPGITRKAGVLAACGALFGVEDDALPVTLVVETDRHAGSVALETWLETSGRRFSGAWWEAVDLPINAPAMFRAGMGRLVASVQATADRPPVEAVYAGVVQDIGHELALAIGGLKSSDAEVLLAGFYDDVSVPTIDEMADIDRIAPQVARWAAPGALAEAEVRADHIALGAFVAPALLVRELHVDDAGPYVATTATATVDIRLTPGQSPSAVLLALAHYLRERLPGVLVEPALTRQPGSGRLLQLAGLAELLPTLPVAPGDSPAGVIEASGVPNAGFATVARRAPDEPERVGLATIASGSDVLRSLVRAAARAVAPPPA
jgi:hypothetical protein